MHSEGRRFDPCHLHHLLLNICATRPFKIDKLRFLENNAGTGKDIMGFLEQILPLSILIAVMTYFTWSTNKRIDDAKIETSKRVDDAKIETSKRVEDAKSETNKRVDETNKRMDDTKEAINQRFDDFKDAITNLLEAKMKPLQEQVTNHLPTAIREVAEASKKRDNELKENQKTIQANQEKMQKNIEQILALLEKQGRKS